MSSTGVNDPAQPGTLSASRGARILLVALCLAAGLAYRILVGLFSPSVLQTGVLAGLAAVFLLLAVLAKRHATLQPYWKIPFAFFIFTVAGMFGDSNSLLSLQQAFVLHVLHEVPSANDPIAATVLGTVLGQLAGTLGLLVPILLLTRASGDDLKSIFVDKPRNRWVLVVGLIAFLVFYLYTASGRAQRFFPNNGVTISRFLALTPALIVLVLLNGLREELWFRGLFLKKYAEFLSPFASNLLSAVLFASFHVQVQYTPFLAIFLGLALIQGLILGYMMQKSGSLLASVIFHAGSDIPIFLIYLSFVSR